jgi:1-acyl-sn-glycerol-3-phosphate acyltransferase
LEVQAGVGRLAAPILVPLLTFAMRWLWGYRIRGVRELRRRVRELRAEGRPLLICSNHLTMIDSALIVWALGSSGYYATHYSALPWNLPERRNFGGAVAMLVYLLKCLPIVRGGSRRDIADILHGVEYVMARGEPVMIFPESGRSRTGRVNPESPALAVGRLISSVPGCRVLCVYLRGDRQVTWSNLPARGDTFSVELAVFEPVSTVSGLRRSRDLTQQVIQRLTEMEEAYFARRRDEPRAATVRSSDPSLGHT